MKYIIECSSAYKYTNCLLGTGDTEAEAWVNAYGPKPWTTSAKKSIKNAWVRQVSDEEVLELQGENQ